MNKRISVIIPNYNGALTIGKCLESVFSPGHDSFEVIVVDDCSDDNSAEIIKNFPCRLIRLNKHSGASRARNTGVQNSDGEILFFIDADCILQKDTLFQVNKAFMEYLDKKDMLPSPPHPPLGKGGHRGVVIGGTYTRVPYDDTFFSTFQSIFVNYSETKKKEPDYIATHAMVIDPILFKNSGGFSEDFLPIIEDVEFSHRLRKSGARLIINPEILVRHIFNFTLWKSLKNAFRKSKYWTIYSLKNRDLFKDSGTASIELKTNVVSFFLMSSLALFFLSFNHIAFLISIFLIFILNIYINRNFLAAFYETKGISFTILATFFYAMIYPLAVGAGSFTGMLKYYLTSKHKKVF